MSRGTSCACAHRRKKVDLVTVPLDALPERCTLTKFPEISTRRSLSAWASLAFRNLASRTGREGEKFRPLDHMWQIPFLRFRSSVRSTHNESDGLYISNWNRFLFYMVHKCQSIGKINDIYTCPFAKQSVMLSPSRRKHQIIAWNDEILRVLATVNSNAHWGKRDTVRSKRVKISGLTSDATFVDKKDCAG